MKIIILAAGIGRRLGIENTPKALARLVNGQSIIEHQLENIARYLSLSDVRVVVGYEQDKIKTLFPHLSYIENSNYGSENTAKSLQRALSEVGNEAVLWLNGDVVFHHKILEPLLAQRRSAMIVNIGVVGEEEVKYQADEFGRIIEVAKAVEDPLGEALGINFFTEGDAQLLKQALAECGTQDYFERAVQICLDAGVEVWTSVVSPDLCVEVDFLEDLGKANRMLKSWK